MRDELLEFFMTIGQDATRVIHGTGARMVRSGPRFGVFFPANISSDYFEDKLNSMTLRTGRIEATNTNGVFISCKDPTLKEQFADECARFLEPYNLQKIGTDPFGWWNELRRLFGNVLSDENHYFLFAEFLIYLILHKDCSERRNGVNVRWKSCAATHDIEMSDGSQHEVKSTVRRSASIITISSKFQLSVDPDIPYFLYFVRLEPGRQDGVSIQDLLGKAMSLGCDMDRIEQILVTQGLTPGSPKRRTRFAVLEAKRYDVSTGPFPMLTPESFRPECANVLSAVEDFSYDINLSAVTCPREDILTSIITLFRD